MAFCNNCGAALDDSKKFCGSCGAVTAGAGAPPVQVQAPNAGQGYANPVGAVPPAPGDIVEFDPADIEKNKTMAGLSYFIFFLPLIACPDSRFARFHANQSLVLLLLLLGIVGSIILTIIPIIGWILLIFFPIFVCVLGIMGLINGFKGVAKELPLIGKLRIIK